jgi:hypothetical protein
MSGLIVLLCMALSDYGWARYIHHVSRASPWQASNWSALLTLLSLTVVYKVSGDPWLLAPAVAGAWLGTWLGTGREE